MEKRDALGFPPKHKGLAGSILDLLNGKAGPLVDHLGDHFLKRRPAVATTVTKAMDRDRVLAANQKAWNCSSNAFMRLSTATTLGQTTCGTPMRRVS